MQSRHLLCSRPYQKCGIYLRSERNQLAHCISLKNIFKYYFKAYWIFLNFYLTFFWSSVKRLLLCLLTLPEHTQQFVELLLMLPNTPRLPYPLPAWERVHFRSELQVVLWQRVNCKAKRYEKLKFDYRAYLRPSACLPACQGKHTRLSHATYAQLMQSVINAQLQHKQKSWIRVHLAVSIT